MINNRTALAMIENLQKEKQELIDVTICQKKQMTQQEETMQQLLEVNENINRNNEDHKASTIKYGIMLKMQDATNKYLTSLQNIFEIDDQLPHSAQSNNNNTNNDDSEYDPDYDYNPAPIALSMKPRLTDSRITYSSTLSDSMDNNNACSSSSNNNNNNYGYGYDSNQELR